MPNQNELVPVEPKLRQLEATVEQNLEGARKFAESVIKVGLALTEINKSKMYKLTHNSFDEYCRKRFGISKSYAYALIRQARSVRRAGQISPNKLSGRAAEQLEKLDGATRTTVIDGLAGQETITAPMVKAAAENLAESIEPKPAPKSCDSLGQVLPKNLISVFSRLPELKELHSEAERLRLKIEAKVESEDDLYRHIRMQQLDTDLRNAKRTIKFSYPYAICPYCKGSKCEKCGGAGWMPKDVINLVPDEDRSS